MPPGPPKNTRRRDKADKSFSRHQSSSMPHATADMGEPSINGDMPSSQFLSHIRSYPIVDDSVHTFKANPYGAKGIDLTNAGYAKFVAPTLSYFKGPFSYVAPYVSKADELGDKSLSKFDEKVPIVKSETKEIKQTVFDYAHWPIEQVGSTKNYVLKTYGDEYKKCGGDGVVAGSKAAITSSLLISADLLGWVSSLLKTKKDGTREVIKEKTGK